MPIHGHFPDICDHGRTAEGCKAKPQERDEQFAPGGMVFNGIVQRDLPAVEFKSVFADILQAHRLGPNRANPPLRKTLLTF
jgi:hypothetical protein